MAVQAAPHKGETKTTCTRWRVILYDKGSGKYDWKTVKGSRAKAEAFERRAKVAQEVGEYTSPRKREMFADTARAYVERLRATGRASSTIDGNRALLNLYLLPALGSCNVQLLTSELYEQRVARPLVAQGKSTDVLDRCAKIMKAVLNHAVRRRVIAHNPFALYRNELQGTKPRTVERRAFTEEELQAIFQHAGKWRPLLMTLTHTGLRPGEAFALRREDLDLAAGTMHVQHSWSFRDKTDKIGRTGKPLQGRLKETKTGESRVLPLDAALVSVLREHLSSHRHDWVFPNRTGRPFRQDNVGVWWRAVLESASVPYASLYSLRHSFCSLAATAGVSEHNIVRAMGHRDSTLIKKVYGHALPRGMREVSDAVAARLTPTLTTPPPARPPTKSPQKRPALRLIKGGAARAISNPLDGSQKAAPTTLERVRK